MDFSQSSYSGLPDPDYDAEFYHDVTSKRLLAWIIDVITIAAIVGLVAISSLFIALIFLPFVYFCVSFFYRWAAIATWSATPGMRFMAIELRDRDGQRLDGTTAFLHTAGYAFSVVTVPLQLISIVLMLTTARKQGLSDTILGTAAINRGIR